MSSQIWHREEEKKWRKSGGCLVSATQPEIRGKKVGAACRPARIYERSGADESLETRGRPGIGARVNGTVNRRDDK